MGTGDGPLQTAPTALVAGMIPLFDPMVLLAAFAGLSMTEYADNLGEEEKNGQSTRPTTRWTSPTLPNFAAAGMPASATIETWVADDGYLVSFIATDFGAVGNDLAIDVTERQRPGQRRGAPELTPEPHEPGPRPRRVRRDGVGRRRRPRRADRPRGHGRRHPDRTRRRPCCERLGAPERVVRVDVEDPASLAAALAETDVVLNATYMRHNVRRHRRRDRRRRPPRRPRVVLPGDAPAARPARRGRGGRLPDRPRLRRGARA